MSRTKEHLRPDGPSIATVLALIPPVALGYLYAMALGWVGNACQLAQGDHLVFVIVAKSPFGAGLLLWPLMGLALKYRSRSPVRQVARLALVMHYLLLAVELYQGNQIQQLSDQLQASSSLAALLVYGSGQVVLWLLLARELPADLRKMLSLLESITRLLKWRIYPHTGLADLAQSTPFLLQRSQSETEISTFLDLAFLVERGTINEGTMLRRRGDSQWQRAESISTVAAFIERRDYLDPFNHRWLPRLARSIPFGNLSRLDILFGVVLGVAVAIVYMAQAFQPATLVACGFSVELAMTWAGAVLVLLMLSLQIGPSWLVQHARALLLTVFLMAIGGHLVTTATRVRSYERTMTFLYDFRWNEPTAGVAERKFGRWAPLVSGLRELQQQRQDLFRELDTTIIAKLETFESGSFLAPEKPKQATILAASFELRRLKTMLGESAAEILTRFDRVINLGYELEATIPLKVTKQIEELRELDRRRFDIHRQSLEWSSKLVTYLNLHQSEFTVRRHGLEFANVNRKREYQRFCRGVSDHKARVRRPYLPFERALGPLIQGGDQ